MFVKYEIPKIEFTQLEDKICSFSYSSLDNEPSYLHSHKTPEAIIPQTNYCRLITPKTTISMKKGNLYIVNPHVMHTEAKIDDSHDAKYFAAKINYSIDSIQQQHQIYIIENDVDFKEMDSYLLMAKKNFEGEGNLQLASLNLCSFFLLFHDALERAGVRLTKRVTENISNTISDVKYYISNNYGNHATIEDICKTFDISHSSLLTKFKKEMGISPIQYMTEQRLKAARYLLKTTDFSIGQISSLCGFDSSAYFSYIFRKNIGCTPKEFRQLGKDADILQP